MDKNLINNVVDWIKNYVRSAGVKGVVLGMSGGKDSLVVAKLCTLAVGEENVFGLILPNGKMADIDDAVETCKLLNIKYEILNIEKTYNSIIDQIGGITKEVSSITAINTAPRVRMTYLYALAGSLNYLVANTSNLSEAMVGYTTKWGDNVGDFAPLKDFTKTEVCEIGLLLGLPKQLVEKIPSDGLSGSSDEDSLGFSYAELDEYIRTGKTGDNFEIISKKHKIAKHKIDPIAKFESGLKNHFTKE